MTVKIEDLEFGVILNEGDLVPLVEIIFEIDEHGNTDSKFVNLEQLRSALLFLETEANR